MPPWNVCLNLSKSTGKILKRIYITVVPDLRLRILFLP
jgi:hypothetical protein